MYVHSKDGFDARIETLRVAETYLGLLEGCPDPDEWVDRLVTNAQKHSHLPILVMFPEAFDVPSG